MSFPQHRLQPRHTWTEGAWLAIVPINQRRNNIKRLTQAQPARKELSENKRGRKEDVLDGSDNHIAMALNYRTKRVGEKVNSTVETKKRK